MPRASAEMPRDSAESLRLSTELLIIVFSHLSYEDFWNCREASSRFRDIIDGTPELLLRLETQAAAYPRFKLLPGPGESIVDSLERFRNIQRAWRDPHVRKHACWTAPTPFDRFEIFGNVLIGQEWDSHDLSVVYMEAEPRLERLAFADRMFVRAVDAKQDLLIALAFDEMGLRCIHFLSLTNGRKHPRAQRRALDETWLGGASMECHHGDVFARMGVSGDWLVFEVGATADEANFYLCHWPSGEIRAQWSSDEKSWYQHAFLTKRHLLLSRVELPRQPYIDVYGLDDFPKPSPDSEPLASFGLPELAEKSLLSGRFTRYFTFPPYHHDSSSTENEFSPDQALLPIKVNRLDSEATLLVPLAVLTPERKEYTSATPTVHTWSSWGPASTCISHKSPCMAFGTRLIFDDDSIWDFNPWDIATNTYAPTSSCDDSNLIRVQSLTSDSEARLDGEVLTRRTYRRTVLYSQRGRSAEKTWDGPDMTRRMLLRHDADGPKLVQPRLDEREAVLRIHVYAIQKYEGRAGI